MTGRRWSGLSGSATALVWAQWVSRELMISLNLKRERKIWEKERERIIRRGAILIPERSERYREGEKEKKKKKERERERESEPAV